MKLPPFSLLTFLGIAMATLPFVFAGDVVFQDSFEAPDGVNVNENLDARQAGGGMICDYEKIGAQPNQSVIISNELKRNGPGALNVRGNFAEQICGKNFSLSADMRCDSPDGWGAMSLLSDTALNRGISPLSVRLHGKGFVVVSTGKAGGTPPPVETFLSPAQIGRVLGKDFRIADTHNYKFVVTEKGDEDRATFFIDGVKFPLKCNTVEFGDETKRAINFINMNDVETDIVYDNLKLMTDVVPGDE